MKKSTLILTVGPPCSGKTTWSRQQIVKDPNIVRLCRDDLRMMLYGRIRLTDKEEEIVTEIIHRSVDAAIDAEKDVIVDQTNCKYTYILDFIVRVKNRATVKIQLFNEPLDVLRKRNQIRAFHLHMKPVEDALIERMHKFSEYLSKNEEVKPLLLNARDLV